MCVQLLRTGSYLVSMNVHYLLNASVYIII